MGNLSGAITASFRRNHYCDLLRIGGSSKTTQNMNDSQNMSE